MLKQIFQLILILPLILGTFISYGQGAWEKEYDQDKLVIYTRAANDIKFREFKAEIVFDGKLEACIAAFVDYKGHKDFMYSIANCELVDRANSQEYYLYYVIDFPWPYTDRDMITKVKFTKQSNTLVTMRLDSYPNKKPLTDLVRMEVTEGEWRFEQINATQLKITYTNKSDPAGNVPAWMANMFLVNGPKDTLLGLKDRTPKYASKTVSWLH